VPVDPKGEAVAVCPDENELVEQASESLLRRCDGPGRGEWRTAAGEGSEMSKEGNVVDAQGKFLSEFQGRVSVAVGVVVTTDGRDLLEDKSDSPDARSL